MAISAQRAAHDARPGRADAPAAVAGGGASVQLVDLSGVELTGTVLNEIMKTRKKIRPLSVRDVWLMQRARLRSRNGQ